jgi:7TM-HD extracellular
MVSRLRRLALAALLVLPAALLPARDFGDYQIGDRAEEDVATPFALTVVDEAAMRILQQREAERIPVSMRYYVKSPDDAEAALRAGFTKSHSNFLALVQTSFHHLPLTAEDMSTPRFQEIERAFQRQTDQYPVADALAEAWAQYLPDEEYLSPQITRLRAAMGHPVRSTDTVPADVKIGSVARLILLESTNEIPTVALASQKSVDFAKTNLISFQRTRTELEDSFPADEHALAKYVSSLVRPNCYVDRDLTLQIRTNRTAGLLVADNYPAGGLIVKRGQLIDGKIRAALSQLQLRLTAVQQKEQQEQKERAAAEQAVVTRSIRRTQWLVAALAGGVLILAAVVWGIIRSSRKTSLLPARVERGVVGSAEPGTGDSAEAWRQRALLAEQRAEKAQSAARSGLLSHLTRSLSNMFVQKLLTQRSEQLEAQQKATAEVDQLGGRLDVLQSRMQERIAAYEKRIQDLERELETQNEANRELIKAEIRAVQRQLKNEQSQSQTGARFN